MATKSQNQPLIKALIIAVLLAGVAYALIFWNPGESTTLMPVREIPAPETSPGTIN